MALPLLVVPAIPAIAASLTTAFTWIAGAVASALVAAQAYDGIMDFINSPNFHELATDKLNTRLAAAGIDLEFGNVFDPEDIQASIEEFMLRRVNAKAGTNFTKIADLNQDGFLAEVGGVLARRINAKTGANLGALWPLDALKAQLHTEAVRQFDNRGRYAGGALFNASTLSKIKEKIAAKNPALMRQVRAVEDGGYWGPPINEKHRKKREAGRARQARYKKTHQQVWARKDLS